MTRKAESLRNGSIKARTVRWVTLVCSWGRYLLNWWLTAGYWVCSSPLKSAIFKLPPPIRFNCEVRWLKDYPLTYRCKRWLTLWLIWRFLLTGTKVLNTKFQCIPKEPCILNITFWWLYCSTTKKMLKLHSFCKGSISILAKKKYFRTHSTLRWINYKRKAEFEQQNRALDFPFKPVVEDYSKVSKRETTKTRPGAQNGTYKVTSPAVSEHQQW